MKKFTKVIALILSLTLLLCFPIGVSAAEPEDTGVDTAAKGSLTIYKVDLTSAEKDGAWDSSYVSTGVYDQNVNDNPQQLCPEGCGIYLSSGRGCCSAYGVCGGWRGL